MAASYLRRNEHQPKQGPVERPIPEGGQNSRAHAGKPSPSCLRPISEQHR